MKETSGSHEGHTQKKILKTLVHTIREKLGDSLSKYNKENIQNSFEKELISQKAKTEKDIIKDILEEKSELLVKRAIVGDIHSYARKFGGEERQETQFKCKYGLSITIENLNSFLDFCAIHGFIPLIDKIYIDQYDITQIKELYTLFAFAITKPSNPLIINSLENEIRKIEKSFQGPAKDVLIYIQQLVAYTTTTYQYLLGDKLQKLKNIGTLSENIFAEIAIRIENQIREKIGIESSYLKLAGFRDDNERKTDMDFILKKTSSQSYQFIPMQFTTGSNVGVKIKERDIEKYLIQNINGGSKIQSFLLLSVNGEFSKHITHGDKEGKLLLNKEYNEWIENPFEREKYMGPKFPLFIDTINPTIIRPAEVMYIALHMLYKKFNFKYSLKDTYLTASKKLGKIDKLNRGEINGIQISDIFISECSVENIENPRENYPNILKHKYIISYWGEQMGSITIYEIGEHKQK